MRERVREKETNTETGREMRSGESLREREVVQDLGTSSGGRDILMGTDTVRLREEVGEGFPGILQEIIIEMTNDDMTLNFRRANGPKSVAGGRLEQRKEMV